VTKLHFLAVIILSLALSGAAVARGGGGHGGGHGGGGHGGGGHGGGGHFGGGHFGGGHFGGARGGGFHGAHFAGGGRHFGGRSASHVNVHGNRSFAGRGAASNFAGRNPGLRSQSVRNAFASRSLARALHNPNALHNPGTRAAIVAAAATAGWHGGRAGWWRHRFGGYGWVGPLFWPFAYYDIYDYSFWGYGPTFWGYGYGDIYAGLFAPYGYDDLTGYLPLGGERAYGGASGAPGQPPDELTQMCGEDNREIAGLPIDRIQQAIQPNDEQRRALDDLANASLKAAQTIKAACPARIVSTAPSRLEAMAQRLGAMIAGVSTVQPALDHFWSLLDDEQKTRLSSLGQPQRRSERNAEAVCSPDSAATEWPAAEIEARLHPTEAQRASLANLKDASARAADMLKTTCAPDNALTPPARLAAVGKRLDTMLHAVETVKSALDDLYKELTDEQKAQFEAIGPGRIGASSFEETTSSSGRHYRHRYHASVGGIVRRLISFGW
jgi:LTXXQ motif family protein